MGDTSAAPNFYVGAYWGPRQESVNSCADRAAQLLSGLKDLHPLFGTWYRQGDSPAQALQHRVSPDREAALSLLESGQIRTDVDGVVMKELGYSMNLWTGKEASAGLSIGCGKFADSEHVKNAVVLKLPRSRGDVAELSVMKTAKAIIRLLVDCWTPDWATWASREWRSAQSVTGEQPVFGWMTYLSQPYSPAELPYGVTVEQFDSGSLITAAPEVADVTQATLIAIRETLVSKS